MILIIGNHAAGYWIKPLTSAISQPKSFQLLKLLISFPPLKAKNKRKKAVKLSIQGIPTVGPDNHPWQSVLLRFPPSCCYTKRSNEFVFSVLSILKKKKKKRERNAILKSGARDDNSAFDSIKKIPSAMLQRAVSL